MSHIRGLVSGLVHEDTPLVQRAKCGSSAEVDLLRILYERERAISLELEIDVWHRETRLGLPTSARLLLYDHGHKLVHSASPYTQMHIDTENMARHRHEMTPGLP